MAANTEASTTLMPCDKCDGTGVITEVRGECPAVIVIGFESIECWATHRHPGKPHAALLCAPCGSCGGYDEHGDGCPRPGVEYIQHGYTWNDSDAELTQLDAEDWQLWRAEHMG